LLTKRTPMCANTRRRTPRDDSFYPHPPCMVTRYRTSDQTRSNDSSSRVLPCLHKNACSGRSAARYDPTRTPRTASLTASPSRTTRVLPPVYNVFRLSASSSVSYFPHIDTRDLATTKTYDMLG